MKNQLLVMTLACVLLACGARAAVAQRTDLSNIDVRQLVLEGNRLLLRDAGGRLASVPDGRHQLPGRAELVLSAGTVVSFSCPGCPSNEAGSSASSTIKTFDGLCALEYTTQYYNSSYTYPILSDVQVGQWPTTHRWELPMGQYSSGNQKKPSTLRNRSSLRLITVKEFGNTTTYQLPVGHHKGYSWSGVPTIEWVECGEPDPVVVAEREEKQKTELVAAAVSALREYLNRSPDY